MRACLERIAERDTEVHAVMFLCAERALAEAREQGSRLAAGEDLGPLAGCPFLVKDLEDVEGLPTTYGCTVFREGNIAAEDSVEVARLRAAGAIVVGKANCSLFGGNAGCKNKLLVTRNPWDTSKTPGGSSGGSAAAVAARMVPFATAADGGGSIRIPAAFCGAFGIKGTYGLVPQTELRQFGMLHFIRCVHFGPITRSVEDACLYLDAVVGEHPADPSSLPRPAGPAFAELCRSPPPPSLRVGFASTLGTCDVAEPDALRHAHAALEALMAALPGGVLDKEFDLVLPDVGFQWAKLMGTQERLAVQDGILARDAASAVGEKGEGGVEKSMVGMWKMLEEATKLDDLGAAHRDLFALNEAMATCFQQVDILATLAMPCDAMSADTSNLPMTLSDGQTHFNAPWHPASFMIPFNFSGHPACVVRSPLNGGLSERTGMPMALQLLAPRHRDGLLLQVAAAYERATGAFQTWPEFDASKASSKL